mgnify:CR=1 FL=1
MSAEYDAFGRTSGAFRSAYRTHEALFISAPEQFRNLVLDQCGSDHRPLVELLLSLGPLVCAQLTKAQPPTPWHARRAPLVHRIVSTRYLQAEVARWVVDTWGSALQLAPDLEARPTVDRPEFPADAAHLPLDAVAVTRSQGSAGPRSSSVVRASRPAPAVPPPPSWAGGPGRTRIGARAPTGLAGQTAHNSTPRWRATGPALNPTVVAQARRFERAWIVVMACTLLGLFVATAIGIANRKAVAVADASVLPSVPVGSLADSIARTAVGPLAPLPATVADAPTAALSTAERSIPTDTIPTDAISTPAPSPGDGARLLSAGLGGRYRLSLQVRSVSGSPSCSQVASALARGRTSIEVLAHTPGTLSLSIASRNVDGRLSPDGYFESRIRTGTTDGVRWSFRMTGQFTAAGLVGETRTSTEAIIRWRRKQSCLTIADLVAERLRP